MLISRKKQRIACVLIAPRLLGDTVKETGRSIVVEKGIPKDAEFLGVNYDSSIRCFRALFKHPSFKESYEGDVIPEFSPIQIRSTLIKKLEQNDD